MSTRSFVSAVPLCLLFLLLVVSGPLAGQTTPDEFTVIVLPDTQYLSRDYPQILEAQTNWIAANRDALNIRMVIGVGDLVQGGSESVEWQNADRAMRALDAAGVPYVLPLGNHDYDGGDASIAQRTAATVNFNTYFGPQRYQSYAWYGGQFPAGSNENFYAVFEAGGKQYLVVALEFYPRDAALEWANGIVAAHPDKDVIITTHSYLNHDDSLVGRCDAYNAESFGLGGDNDPEEMWEKFVSRHANIRLVVSGHVLGDGAGRLHQHGIAGNRVNQFLANFQHEPEGGSGYLRILRIRPAQNLIEVQTYSPYLQQYRSDEQQQFSVPYVATGNETTGGIHGRVWGADCAPIPQASVETGGFSAPVGSDGSYDLGNEFAPGAFSLTAGASNWAPAIQEVVVQAGQSTVADFYLAGERAVSVLAPLDGSIVTAPVPVLATAQSPAGVKYMQVWVDGIRQHHVDGATVDVKLPLTSGKHRLSVTSTDRDNVTSKVTVMITAEAAANQPPVAQLNVTPTSGTAPLTVTASSAASTDADGGVVGGSIDFGDGTVVNGLTATHTYNTAGTYAVTATVIDDQGASSTSAPVAVTVQNSDSSSTPCQAASDGVMICAPGQGAGVGSPVRLVAAAKSSSPVKFVQVWVDGLRVLHQDGSSLDVSLALAAGTRRISVTATDTNKLTLKSTVNVSVSTSTTENKPPSAQLAVTPTSGTAPLTVTASSAGSTDPDGSIAGGAIDFGDGTVVNGREASHTYTVPGTYTVKATVTDDKGASAVSAGSTVTVSAATGTCTAAPDAVTICAPANGATVTSPVRIQALGHSDQGVKYMQAWVDGVRVLHVNGAAVDAGVAMATGTRRLVVTAIDNAGVTRKSTVYITVQ